MIYLLRHGYKFFGCFLAKVYFIFYVFWAKCCRQPQQRKLIFNTPFCQMIEIACFIRNFK